MCLQSPGESERRWGWWYNVMRGSPQIQVAVGFVVFLLWHANPRPRGCCTAKLVLEDVMWDLHSKHQVSALNLAAVLQLFDLDVGWYSVTYLSRILGWRIPFFTFSCENMGYSCQEDIPNPYKSDPRVPHWHCSNAITAMVSFTCWGVVRKDSLIL